MRTLLGSLGRPRPPDGASCRQRTSTRTLRNSVRAALLLMLGFTTGLFVHRMRPCAKPAASASTLTPNCPPSAIFHRSPLLLSLVPQHLHVPPTLAGKAFFLLMAPIPFPLGRALYYTQVRRTHKHGRHHPRKAALRAHEVYLGSRHANLVSTLGLDRIADLCMAAFVSPQVLVVGCSRRPGTACAGRC